ncbi:MAG: cupredoxin domain-containing protein, partial [Synergistaceae bacterium]|nr:cupredoxin domain-containing protein [Synergistaceae bacterium]
SGLDSNGFGAFRDSPAPVSASSSQAVSPNTAVVNTSGVQEVTTPLSRRGYPAITVRAGTPVRWNLSAEQGAINGCNNAIVIPEFKIEKRLRAGDNIIEFTPTKAGRFRYSCWMGMIRGTITVVDADAAGAPDRTAALLETPAEAAEQTPADDDSASPSCACCRSF